MIMCLLHRHIDSRKVPDISGHAERFMSFIGYGGCRSKNFFLAATDQCDLCPVPREMLSDAEIDSA